MNAFGWCPLAGSKLRCALSSVGGVSSPRLSCNKHLEREPTSNSSFIPLIRMLHCRCLPSRSSSEVQWQVLFFLWEISLVPQWCYRPRTHMWFDMCSDLAITAISLVTLVKMQRMNWGVSQVQVLLSGLITCGSPNLGIISFIRHSAAKEKEVAKTNIVVP